MICFKVDDIYIQDLKDDFIMNEDKNLYEFIDNDLVKAFYLGYYILDWFELIDKKQQYLYSKQARHNKDSLKEHLKQIEFWSNKYESSNKEVDLTHLGEFILNNIIFEKETEELDKVKLAFFFGNTVKNEQNKEKS